MRNEIGGERNRRIVVKDNFTATLKKVVNKKVAETLEQAHLEVEAKREREREKRRILEGPLEVATTKYLASDAFEIVKVDCFGKGSKTFGIWR